MRRREFITLLGGAALGRSRRARSRRRSCHASDFWEQPRLRSGARPFAGVGLEAT